MPFNILWNFTYPGVSLMTFFLSFDRLLLTVFPLWYISKGTKIGKCMFTIAFLHSCSSLIIVYVSLFFGLAVYVTTNQYRTNLCYMSYHMPQWYYKYRALFQNVAYLGSVIVCIMQLFLYWRHNKKVINAI